jgi:hypothetical protein
MSRAMNVALREVDVLSACKAEDVGVSAIEALPAGGVRLVCMSMAGAGQMRRKFKSQLIQGEPAREKLRPRSPLW